MTVTARSMCRMCQSFCPVVVTLDGREILSVEGNPDAPIFKGFTCPKGRALGTLHNNPNRLLRSLKRQPDSSYEPISSDQLVEEVSDKLASILAESGPHAVSCFLGGPTLEQQASAPMLVSFMQAIRSPMFYSDATLDQPGLAIAASLHGVWEGGRMRPEDWDVFLMVGGNPIISKQYFPQNPGDQLKTITRRGTKLIVIDPRRTETARRATVHLQCIPGEDPTILAGLIHLVIANGQINADFVGRNARGLDELAAAVSRFTPDYVAARAGISEEGLRDAARIIGEAKGGDIGTGTGPSMSTRGTLSSYLAVCLQTLRGFWAREGDEARRPHVLRARKTFKAQPSPPSPAWGFGVKTRVRGLQQTSAGMPAGALPEEILTPGEGQIRALFLHAGAMLNWPDQDLVRRAMDALDLLVVHDVDFSPTARVADYVIATKRQFEIPALSQWNEITDHPGYGFVEPYGSYYPALLDPPEGSDLLESWQIYYRVARKLGLPLHFGPFGFSGGPSHAVELDMEVEPTTDQLYEMMCKGSVIPLDEVKSHPDGHVFDTAREFVGPRDADCTARLELAHEAMLGELAEVRAEDPLVRRGVDEQFPFQLIPRRLQNVTNAASRPVPGILKSVYNPAFMHSEDLRRLGVAPGDMVHIRSRHGEIVAFVEADDALRTGLVSITHGFGKNPGEDYDPRRDGSNVNRLIRWEDDYDPYHGMPRMGALPVSVRAAADAEPAVTSTASESEFGLL